MKCKRCRTVLFTEEATPLLSAHGEVRNNSESSQCVADRSENCLFISSETIPDWIKDHINKVQNFEKNHLKNSKLAVNKNDCLRIKASF